VDSSTRKDLTSHTVLTVDTEALAVDTGVSMHVVWCFFFCFFFFFLKLGFSKEFNS
jgi:hypothetical protein